MTHDFGGSMSPTTGIFTAPQTGLYHFKFHSHIGNNNSGRLHFYINGEKKQEFWHNDADAYGRSLDPFWTYSLQKGDEVYLYNVYGSSFRTNEQRTLTFMGSFVP